MIDPLPSLDRTSTNFKTDLDAFFLTQLPTFSVQAEAARSQVNTDAAAAHVDAAAAAASRTAALASEQAAASYAGAERWVSGTTYPTGKVVWSPVSQWYYRRNSLGGGITDPSADPSNWSPVSTLSVAQGGTGATNASQARSNLGVPSTAGAGASGTWDININGVASTAANANACSGNSATATKASTLASGGLGPGMTFAFGAEAGTPQWVWGTTDGQFPLNKVYNPATFSVSYATNAGNASTVSSITAAQVGGATVNLGVYGVGSYVFAKNLTGASVGPAGVVAGSSLTPSDSGDGTGSGGTMVGTWQLNGWCANARASLWLRIA